MIISTILFLVVVYLACGILFAVPFIMKGVSMIDEGAKGSSVGFRIIIIPGVVVFWPLLLRRWINFKSKSHDEAA